MLGGTAFATFGVRATLAFVANEVKDEALSRLSGGLTDILDATKLGSKLIKEGSSTIYRAVSKAELDDITESGLIRPKEGGMETKLFTDNVSDAKKQGTLRGRNST